MSKPPKGMKVCPDCDGRGYTMVPDFRGYGTKDWIPAPQPMRREHCPLFIPDPKP